MFSHPALGLQPTCPVHQQTNGPSTQMCCEMAQVSQLLFPLILGCGLQAQKDSRVDVEVKESILVANWLRFGNKLKAWVPVSGNLG